LGLSETKEPKYTYVKANGHILTIKGQSAKIPGQIVCIGNYTKPANEIDFRTVLNFTDFFFPDNSANLFDDLYGQGQNIFTKVKNFIIKHKEEVMQSNYFIAAINKTKGVRAKRDLPNVNAAVLAWLLENLCKDVIFMDPIDFLTDPMIATSRRPVKLTNFSKVVRHIRSELGYYVPLGADNNPKSKGSVFINYQRGQGCPGISEKEAILEVVNDSKAHFINVRLTPGKYDYSGVHKGVPKLCYKEFGPAVAQVINQFTDFKEYLKFTGDTCLKQMYLVMDEFSGYAMFTVAALVGFGFDRITTVLCYHRGKYSQFKLSDTRQ